MINFIKSFFCLNVSYNSIAKSITIEEVTNKQ